MEEIKIFEGVKTVNGFPAIFVEEEECLVISDLHLGYELALVKQGIFLPQVQLKEMLKDLKKAQKITNAKILVINGDVKHEFGEASRQEWREVRKFIEFSRKIFREIVLVRGNHDNYLLTIASKLGINVFDPYWLKGKFCFLHGHKEADLPWEKIEVLIIGHEQPSILLKRGFDRVKIPCILYGRMKNGKKLICIPSFSSLSSGTVMNLMEKEDLLSPFLKKYVEVYEMGVIGLDKEIGALKFPKLKHLMLKEDI